MSWIGENGKYNPPIAYDNIRSAEVNLAKLKQRKQAITEKMETLSLLDAQLLDLTAVDTLNEEIEQADTVRGNLMVCIIDIHRVSRVYHLIKAVTVPVTETPSVTEDPVVWWRY